MIIVTGASSGIGKEVARLLATSGGINEEIILISRRNPRLPNTTWLRCDFCSSEEVDRLTTLIKAKKDPISFLLHCAGVMPTSSIKNLSYDQMIDAYKVNTVAPSLITSSLIRQLARGQASVVAISSIAADIHIPGELIYSSSKSALAKTMESFSSDSSRFGSTFLVVSPSLISSQMTASLSSDQEKFMQSRRLSKDNPSISDIAEYLVSLRSSSKFITGSNIYFGGVRR